VDEGGVDVVEAMGEGDGVAFSGKDAAQRRDAGWSGGLSGNNGQQQIEHNGRDGAADGVKVRIVGGFQIFSRTS
jgi:hypothetical protein